MCDVVSRFCDIHKIEYKAKHIKKLNLYSLCPACKKEIENKEKEELARLAIEKEKEQEQFLNENLIKNSNIPKKFLYERINKGVANVKNNIAYLQEPLRNNIFIIGGVGVGKTIFLSKILINNKDRFPLYLSGSKLALFSKRDFKLSEVLGKVAGRGIIAIDEADALINGDNFFILDLIVNEAYNQDSKIIISGNFTKKSLSILRGEKYKRFSNRIKQGGLDILDFGNVEYGN